MPHTRLRPSFAFTEERLAQLKRVVPEAFADGKVNWDALREALGVHLELDEGDAEHFGLSWPGKREARRVAALPPEGTLVPASGEGVDEQTTRNLFIEGENLEVLKLLQKSYAGRAKLIYIDPPYNTGNDFIYEDDFKEPIETYLRRTGQLGETGEPATTNTRADGRFHAKWLSMIYPRLRLARGLLRDDGFIVVSIDDVELANLRAVMDEVFGPENHLAVLVYDRNRKNDARFFSVGHEYMLVYARSKDFLIENDIVLRLPKDGVDEVREKWSDLRRKHADNWQNVQRELRDWFKELPADDPRKPLARFSKVDEHGPYRDDGNINWPGGGGPRYDVFHPVTKKKCKVPNSGWRYPTPERMQEMIRQGVVVFGPTEAYVPKVRTNLFAKADQVLKSVHYSYAQTAAQQFDAIFDGKRVFDNPKPFPDIAKLVEYLTDDDDLVVDFYAGSATTGHAVLDRNGSLGSRRSFLLVQMPEPIDASAGTGKVAAELGMKTVADVGKQRLRRLLKKMAKEKKVAPGEDRGFRVLRLARSHYRKWEDYEGDNINRLQMLFDEAERPLVDRWTAESLLTEVMLIEGFPLDSQVEAVRSLNKNAVARVSSNHCDHVLLACFDDKLHADTLKALELDEQDVFVCLDSAVTDEVKLRVSDRCQLKTI